MKSILAIVCLCMAVAQQANGGRLTHGIGNVIRNVFHIQAAESPLGRSLQKASCSYRAVKAAETRGWKACVNLTQSITMAQQLGLDVFELGQEVRAAGAEFYKNVSTCQDASLLDTVICFTRHVQEAGPAYHRLVATAREHLEMLRQLHYDIVSFYSGCFTKDSYSVDGRSYDLQSLVETFCPAGTNLDEMYKTQAKSLTFHMYK